MIHTKGYQWKASPLAAFRLVEVRRVLRAMWQCIAACARNPRKLLRLGLTLFAALWISGRGVATVAAIVGGESLYVAQAGDSLELAGARFGVAAESLARMNDLDPDSVLGAGQIVRIDNRHIVPERLEQGILVNVPQRMLFHFRDGRLSAYYPVGLGRPEHRTPRREFVIRSMVKDPTWNVPNSIQLEMLLARAPVVETVPPGPNNPIGKYWIGLSIPGYGIHGTNLPRAIYRFSTHGCIRLRSGDIAELFAHVSIGEPGRIIYRPLMLAEAGDGRVFLEVHRDVYGLGLDQIERARELAQAQNLSDLIDWRRARKVVGLKEGIAREVTRGKPVLGWSIWFGN